MENATKLIKIKWNIQDFFQSLKLHHIKQEYIRKFNNLTDDDKTNKKIKHKIITKGDFKLHFILFRSIKDKTIIANCGSFHVPYLCYKVYLIIEYDSILTKQYKAQENDDLDKATNNFYNLVKKYRNRTIKSIITELSNDIDSYCNELKNEMLLIEESNN